ncbi:MAG: hypothetical protein C4581_01675 [Nitrospiraceae bacterium]|nr:MAG: hypothetical protein C4581_01675 [Nitrospiraceae bacterium]
MKDERTFSYPLLIIILALLSFGRTMALHDVAWDDNCWLLSSYFTNNLDGFLDTGFYELRRVPMGVLYYYYYLLHTLTDHAHLIWNSFNMVVQVLSPLLLYAFIKNTLKGQKLLSFLIAAGFIICPIDMTLPYYANINYRLGTFFCILSFYLTERALAGKTSWALLLASMASSAFPLYFLLETALTLEPARLLLIGYVLSGKCPDRRTLIKKTLDLWIPFVLLCVPLIIYRLISKPYGIYSSTYTMNPYFFMNIKMHIKVLRHFLFYNWAIYLSLIQNTGLWSVIAGLITTIITLIYSDRFVTSGIEDIRTSKNAFKDSWLLNWKSVRPVFIFGLMLIIPPVMMYEFSGRIPAPGMEGRHGTILLFGYSIVFGSLLYCLYRTLLSKWKVRAKALIILVLSLGVFFNNVNLDLYKMGENYQKGFWKAFTARFPSLPDKATFLIDANANSPFYNADLEAYYELEFPLNMLYARSKSHDEFLNYRVYAISEGIRDEWKQSSSMTFQRYSHAGKDTFVTDRMIFIHYRDGELLVNREILDKFPDVPYNMWLDKDLPGPSGKIPEYPLRYKLKGFY